MRNLKLKQRSSDYAHTFYFNKRIFAFRTLGIYPKMILRIRTTFDNVHE